MCWKRSAKRWSASGRKPSVSARSVKSPFRKPAYRRCLTPVIVSHVPARLNKVPEDGFRYETLSRRIVAFGAGRLRRGSGVKVLRVRLAGAGRESYILDISGGASYQLCSGNALYQRDG